MSHLPPAESAPEIPTTTIVTIPDSEEVIEGEILETQSEVPLEQSLLNFVTNPVRDSQQQSEAIASWLLLQEDAIFGTDQLSPLKNWLAFFLTPGRFTALGVLLLANLLLALSQLSVPKSGASLQATAKFVPPLHQPPIKEIAPGLSLAAEKSQLALTSLSTATPASPPVASATTSLPTPQAAPVATTATASLPTPQAAPVATTATAALPTTQTAPVATLPTPQTAPVATTATAALPTPQATRRGTAATPSPSNTLFYYYYPAQAPQPVQSYPNTQVTTAPLPTAPSSQSSPVPAPQLPSVQQPPTVQPPSPPTPEDLGQQSIIRQDLDRLRLEQENQPPLGFNQEYRIKVQSAQTQTDPTQLRQQLQQLQQQATPSKLE